MTKLQQLPSFANVTPMNHAINDIYYTIQRSACPFLLAPLTLRPQHPVIGACQSRLTCRNGHSQLREP